MLCFVIEEENESSLALHSASIPAPRLLAAPGLPNVPNQAHVSCTVSLDASVRMQSFLSPRLFPVLW
jgi:hypothetical protein